MSELLFYKNVVPLNSETHRDLHLKAVKKPLAFAKEANLIPALVDEFEFAMDDLPIAFLPGKEQPSAVFVAGLEPGSSVFITEDGLWNGKYAPAYLRRYPFIIGDVEGGESVLCVDDSYEGLSKTDGVRFFSKDGKPEESVTNALALAQNYRAAADRTDEFVKKLNTLKLLRDIKLDAKMPDGSEKSVHGLQVLDEEAFAALPAKALGELHKAGFLKAIYSHLFSLRSVPKLISGAEPAGK
ncbi:MAG: SapC family protein [Rhizobiaceae bacterium]|nr:SapC family protein [Rhizobiaceae bacterium]